MSDDPKRLFEDRGLPPGLREDLSAAARGEWARYDEAAGLSRLLAALAPLPGPDGGGSAEGPGGPGAGGAPVAQGSMTAGGLLGGKFLAVIALSAAGLSGAGIVWFALHGGGAPAMPREAMQTVATAAASAVSAPEIEPGAAVDPGPGASLKGPLAPAAAASPAALSASPAVAAASAQSSRASGARSLLGDEVAQLGRIRAALGRDPAAALAMVEEGNQLYKGGTLGPERELIAIDALSKLGRRSEAAARGRRLLSRVPDGPFAERIRALIEP